MNINSFSNHHAFKFINKSIKHLEESKNNSSNNNTTNINVDNFTLAKVIRYQLYESKTNEKVEKYGEIIEYCINLFQLNNNYDYESTTLGKLKEDILISVKNYHNSNLSNRLILNNRLILLKSRIDNLNNRIKYLNGILDIRKEGHYIYRKHNKSFFKKRLYIYSLIIISIKKLLDDELSKFANLKTTNLKKTNLNKQHNSCCTISGGKASNLRFK